MVLDDLEVGVAFREFALGATEMRKAGLAFVLTVDAFEGQGATRTRVVSGRNIPAFAGWGDDRLRCSTSGNLVRPSDPRKAPMSLPISIRRFWYALVVQ